jgi:hypothetical protein
VPQPTSQSNLRCAGAATRNHDRGIGSRQRVTTPKRGRRGRCLRVDARPELRAEPDWDRFAWALLQYVRAQREEAAGPSQGEGDTQ